MVRRRHLRDEVRRGRRRSHTGACLAIFSALASAPALADVNFDGSMGAPGLAPTEVDLQGRTVHVIDQDRGTTRGALLFHSVDRFNVPSNEGAVMRGSASIETVIMRQTGPAPLTLDGAFVSELPNADILAVSPSGIVTGPGASIDVPGSFYLSGAESVHFEDGSVFDATGAAPAGLLTSAPPAAFGFGTASGTATLQASDAGAMRVGNGERLSITGTQVIASGGNSTGANLGGPGSDVQLGAAESGLLPLDLASLDPAQLPSGTELGRVAMIGRYGIDVSTGAADTRAGRVVIRGSQLFIQGSSSVRSAHEASGNALGAIDIAASEQITVQQGASIESRSASETGGAGSDIWLDASEILVTGAGTNVEVASEASGRSGRLGVRAATLSVDAGAVLASSTTADVVGQGGALDLQASESIDVRGGAGIRSSTDGAATGGDILLSAPSIAVDGLGSELLVATESTGQAGAIDATADFIRIDDDGQVSSKTTSASLGPGGDITLRATGALEVARGGQLVSLAEGAGHGGSLGIFESGEVRVLDEGRIRSETALGGAGGSIQIEARSVAVRVDPSLQAPTPTDITTETRSASVSGRGGDLAIEAGSVMLEGGGQITVRTSGGASSGDLTLDLGAGSLTVLGKDASDRPSGLFARASSTSLPVAGEEPALLSVTAGSIELRDGAEISASTFSDARGPAIVLNVDGDLQIGRAGERAALVSSSSLGPTSAGDAGSITATAMQVRLEGGGEIITDTVGGGDAGAIRVTADDVEIRGVDVLGARSRISSESKSTALAAGGDAGEIVVEAAHTITVADEGVVSVASAGIGGGGSILLDAGDTILLDNRALVSAEAAGSRDAGRITLMAGYSIEGLDSEIVTRAAVGGGGQVVLETSELVHLIRTDIDAQVNAGGGNGGDIEIDPRLVVLNDSDLIANAIDGNGGSILIVANQLLSSKDSGRFFSSQFGLDGSEVVTAPQSEVPSNLASIQQSVIDASDLMAERCDLRSERSGSFTIVKGAAARPAADDVLVPQWLEEDGAPAMCDAPNDARSLE